MVQTEIFQPMLAHTMAGRLINKKAIQDFVFAGNAVFTIRNTDTGDRFTFKVTRSKTISHKYYVKNLRGPGIYMVIGTIMGHDKNFYTTEDWKAKVNMAVRNFITLHPGQPFPYEDYNRKNMPESVKLFIKFLTWYKSKEEKIAKHEIWHEGVCARCGRKLTDPSSIERGMGLLCANLIDRGHV